MKIAEVKTIPLGGATHDHGWPGGTDPNVQYNTLVEVISDEGISGIGSCYTTRTLVEGALHTAGALGLGGMTTRGFGRMAVHLEAAK